jgi:1,4-dihydroxy-2-naphthoate octaprenyltransferase
MRRPPSAARFSSYVWRFYHLLRLGRPLFLVGGFALHALGASMALSLGVTLSLVALVGGQIAITAIQIMTHYSNDYFDLAADRANQTPTRWSGGSRVLVEGHVGGRAALATALGAAGVAAIAAVWLAFAAGTGPLTLPLLLLALVLAWGYSSPPLFLNDRALGEVTGAILIAGLTPLVGFYLQAGRLAVLPFLAVFPLACLQFAMLLVINFPDAAGDAAAGKRTLVTVLGPARAARLHALALVLAYGLLPWLIAAGLPAAAGLALLIVSPLALWLGWRMARGAWADPQQWNGLGLWSIGLLMASVVAETVAFLFQRLVP